MKKGCLGVIIAFVVLLLIGKCVGGDEKAETPAVDTVDVSTNAEIEPSTSSKETEEISWEESTETDEMRGTTNVWNYIVSDNRVDFDFPYNGGSAMRIDVRYMKQYGTDVILTISKGQFSGSAYSGDNYVNIKFDNGAIKKYYFNEPEDASSDCVFLRKKSELIKSFSTAHDIMIEAPFFQAGRRVFKFHVDKPLKWKH